MMDDAQGYYERVGDVEEWRWGTPPSVEAPAATEPEPKPKRAKATKAEAKAEEDA